MKQSPNASFHVEDEETQVEKAPARTGPKYESAADAAARIRAEREAGTRPRTLNGMTQKLQVYGSIPGYHLAIMNDDKNRVQEAQAHGWTIVHATEIEGTNGNLASYNTDPGGLVRFPVGTKENGEPLYGYLLKLPEEIWQDDQAEHERLCARVDAQLLRGSVPGETERDKEERLTKVGGVGSRIASTRLQPASS